MGVRKAICAQRKIVSMILPTQVMGPSPLRASTKPAAVTAATRVLRLSFSMARSAIVFDTAWEAITLSITWMTPFDAYNVNERSDIF